MIPYRVQYVQHDGEDGPKGLPIPRLPTPAELRELAVVLAADGKWTVDEAFEQLRKTCCIAHFDWATFGGGDEVYEGEVFFVQDLVLDLGNGFESSFTGVFLRDEHGKLVELNTTA
jgi:hypothetical protein